MSGKSFILSADWLITSPHSVYQDGRIRVVDVKVAEVGTGLREEPGKCPLIHLPGRILMPGMVNAHTHLELTPLRGACRGLEFPDWISEMTRLIRQGPPELWAQGAGEGVREMLMGGVTAVADHSTFGASPQMLDAEGMPGVVYQEVFCVDPAADHSETLAQLRSSLEAMQESTGGRIRMGISAHAPYNAAPSALKALTRDFKEWPRSIHVCETADEVSYVRSGTGQIAESHRARGFEVTPRRMSPVEYLDNCSYWHSGSMAIHLTHATMGDFAMLRNRGTSAVFCPTSNARLEGAVPPIASARRVGLTCGLGTDSAVSSERLDMFEEMRQAVLGSQLRKDPIDAAEAFAMATIEGAKACGLEGSGTLDVGARADIVALELMPSAHSNSRVEDVVWQGSAERVTHVWLGGRLVKQDG